MGLGDNNPLNSFANTFFPVLGKYFRDRNKQQQEEKDAADLKNLYDAHVKTLSSYLNPQPQLSYTGSGLGGVSFTQAHPDQQKALQDYFSAQGEMPKYDNGASYMNALGSLLNNMLPKEPDVYEHFANGNLITTDGRGNVLSSRSLGTQKKSKGKNPGKENSGEENSQEN